jgi:hypothetical protein
LLAEDEADLLTTYKNEVKANTRRSLSHLASQWPTAEHKAAIEAAELKLEQRKLPKETIVIDHFTLSGTSLLRFESATDFHPARRTAPTTGRWDPKTSVVFGG